MKRKLDTIIFAEAGEYIGDLAADTLSLAKHKKKVYFYFNDTLVCVDPTDEDKYASMKRWEEKRNYKHD